MLLCLPSSRFSLASPPTCVFAPPHRLRTEGRPPCARSWKSATSSSTSTDPPSTAADRKPSSSSRARTGYWSSPSGGEHSATMWTECTECYLRTCFFSYTFMTSKHVSECLSWEKPDVFLVFYRHLTSSWRWLTVVGRKVKQEAGGRSGRLFAWHANTHQDFPDVSQEVTFDLWGVTLKADSDKKRWTGSLELCARFRSKLTL